HGIARLVEVAPQVYPDRPACGEMSSGEQQHSAASATHVQDTLVTAKPQFLEQSGPHHELASKRGVEVGSDNGQDEKEGHKRQWFPREDCQGELHQDQECHKRGRVGSVNPIRTTSTRLSTLKHCARFLGSVRVALLEWRTGCG